MQTIPLGNIGFTVATTSQIILQGTTQQSYPLTFTHGSITTPYLRCTDTSIYWTYTLYTRINGVESNMSALLYINDVLYDEMGQTTNHTHDMTFHEDDIITMTLVYNGIPVADNDIDVQMTLYTLRGW